MRVFLLLLIAVSYLLNIVFCKNSVIIIGAGASGIAAASRLLENGIENITILEAEDRIGGRVQSVKFGDAYVDLGAQWCHGENGNIVYELVKDLNLLKHSGNVTINVIHSTGEKWDNEFTTKLLGFYEDIYETQGFSYTGEDTTVEDFFRTRYQSQIEETFANDSLSLRRAREAQFLLENYICAWEGSYTLDQVSIKTTFEEMEGDHALSWDGKGYKTIFDVLMKKIPNPSKALPVEEQILFKKEVIEIQTNASKVSVNCSDGSAYSADYVIFTPSIGVLKDRYKILFGEEFPKKKEELIKTVGFSSAMKIFLHFEKPFWPSDLKRTSFVWSFKEREEIAKSNKSWWLGVTVVSQADRNPNVLSIWIGGKAQRDLETLTDEELIEDLYSFLKRFMIDLNVTKPDGIVRSKWYSNPHFQGIYSYPTIEARKITTSPPDVLQEPLLGKNGKPLVLFAGEATNPIHFGTVNGAIESGFREADRIIDLINTV